MRSVDNCFSPLIEENSYAKQQHYKKIFNAIYSNFAGHIAKGCKYSAKGVVAFVQGQVFTGAQAEKNRLVDELGGLTHSIEVAAQLGLSSSDMYKADTPENICVKVTPMETQFSIQQQLISTTSQMLQAEVEHILLHDNPPQVEAKHDDIYFKR
ncbi:hypothetical protein GGI23_001269 [Coemansia sp. RSA 2559]|nr:hypothetical protein GGI23_001269 [Coemansia sp. RSA 2559]